ncbi:glycosyltransferase family 2 protein [Neobacillus terrae]|uniref:glycosyltransferase family 2 protein n=1 Tax=Neobacillus terrae TaxID=3034837 RepID=UPI00140CE7B9|nr:glycosyltransferase family 2 protein [Neobacillus terrae]NHM29961.1 glycosyltransferase [Neobacillus terrae]
MSKYSISLCMIVKNEEEFLRRCLKSVSKIVSEIIIIDTGSTDSTIQIAEEFNSKVYNFKWNGDFAEARNYSIKFASSDYILVLDADEYLDENNFILSRNLESGKDFYIFNIKNYLDSQTFNHQAIRVFKNHRGFKYKGKIHEHINIEDFNGLTKEQADTWIYHTGYKSNTYNKKNKHNRNLKLLLEEVNNNPTGYNYFNLGNQYRANGEFDKALSSYKKAYYLSKDRVYLSYLLNQMGKCLLNLERHEEGIELILNSIDNFPTYTDLYFTLGELYEALGYLKDAEAFYLKCLELGEVNDQQTTEGVGSYLARLNLARVYQQLGDLPKALEQSFVSLQKHKGHLPTLINLIKLLKKGEVNPNETRKFLDSSYPIREQVDINNIFITLFLTRSQLLLHYIETYNLKVEKEIYTIALQYGNREMEAYNKWKQASNVTYELAEDIVALSFKLNSTELLNYTKDHFNNNDFTILNGILSKKDNIELSTRVKNFLRRVIIKAGLLNDRETVIGLLNILTNHNTIEDVDLIKDLTDAGLKDITRQFITDYLNNYWSSKGYIEILGSLKERDGSIKEALKLFKRLLEIEPKYRNYERLYNTYMKKNDYKSMDILKEEIKCKFPLVKWVVN